MRDEYEIEVARDIYGMWHWRIVHNPGGAVMFEDGNSCTSKRMAKAKAQRWIKIRTIGQEPLKWRKT